MIALCEKQPEFTENLLLHFNSSVKSWCLVLYGCFWLTFFFKSILYWLLLVITDLFQKGKWSVNGLFPTKSCHMTSEDLVVYNNQVWLLLWYFYSVLLYSLILSQLHFIIYKMHLLCVTKERKSTWVWVNDDRNIT